MSESPSTFQFLGKITQIVAIAEGPRVRASPRLKRQYGGKRWRKMKGIAQVEKYNGWIGKAEIHWYEAHGVGKVEWKIKAQLEP